MSACRNDNNEQQSVTQQQHVYSPASVIRTTLVNSDLHSPHVKCCPEICGNSHIINKAHSWCHSYAMHLCKKTRKSSLFGRMHGAREADPQTSQKIGFNKGGGMGRSFLT